MSEFDPEEFSKTPAVFRAALTGLGAAALGSVISVAALGAVSFALMIKRQEHTKGKDNDPREIK